MLPWLSWVRQYQSSVDWLLTSRFVHPRRA